MLYNMLMLTQVHSVTPLVSQTPLEMIFEVKPGVSPVQYQVWL